MALSDYVSTSMEHAPGELTVPPGTRCSRVSRAARTGESASSSRDSTATSRRDARVRARRARGTSGSLATPVTVMPVPGAFELPLAAMALAKTRRFSCVVALGCVIRGDTPHFDYVSSEAASGLQLAAIETGVPVAFGVLTLDRADQAESRNAKGAEAVRTASKWRTSSPTCVLPRRASRVTPRSTALPGTSLPDPHRLVTDALPMRGRCWSPDSVPRLPLPSGVACPRSAHSVARSLASVTTGATRWSRPSAVSIRTCRRYG